MICFAILSGEKLKVHDHVNISIVCSNCGLLLLIVLIFFNFQAQIFDEISLTELTIAESSSKTFKHCFQVSVSVSVKSSARDGDE